MRREGARIDAAAGSGLLETAAAAGISPYSKQDSRAAQGSLYDDAAHYSGDDAVALRMVVGGS